MQSGGLTQTFREHLILTGLWWTMEATVSIEMSAQLSQSTWTYLLITYFMQNSPSWEANWFSSTQEIPSILWYEKYYYRVYKYRPPVLILSHFSPINALQPPSWSSIWVTCSHLRLALSLRFPTKPLYASILSHHNCYTHRPSNSSRFDYLNNNWWEVTEWHSKQQYCSQIQPREKQFLYLHRD